MKFIDFVTMGSIILGLMLVGLVAWHDARKSNDKRSATKRKKVSMRVLDEIFYFDTEHERDIFIRTAGWKKKTEPNKALVLKKSKWYNYRPALIRINRDGPRISVIAAKPILYELDSLVNSSKRWEIIGNAAIREYESLKSACEEAQKLNDAFRKQIEALKKEHERMEEENPSCDELQDEANEGAAHFLDQVYKPGVSAREAMSQAIAVMYASLKAGNYEPSQVTIENKAKS